MKLIIASYLHGSAYWCGKLCELIEKEDPDRVVLLGDLLYHGPRNDLPRCVADMLAISREYDASWFCAGAISKKGHPHHPLYLRKDEKLKPFDTEAYLKQID